MDGLRLILLVIGILIVLAVYLWERSRRPASPRRSLLDKDVSIDLEPPSQDIVAVTVMAKEGRFSGESLRQIIESIGMTYGDDGLFHYVGKEGQPLFSLGNVLKPGYFEDPSLKGLSTPGVLLFVESPEASATMLNVALQLAQRLGGEVCDENRRPLAMHHLNLGELHGRP